MRIILSLISIPIAILIAIENFGIFESSALIPFISVTTIGALMLIIVQLYTLLFVHIGGSNSTMMGKVIMIVLALPALLYFLDFVLHLSATIDLQIIIASFLFTEGIYGLH